MEIAKSLEWFWSEWLTRERFLKFFIIALLLFSLYKDIIFKESLLAYDQAYCWNVWHNESWKYDFVNGMEVGYKNLSDVSVPTQTLNITFNSSGVVP
jgi:hypothetical protein